MIKASLSVRGLLIDPPLLLAPMAGLTHSALRSVITRFGGAGLLATEMLSARRLPMENQEVSPYLIRTEAERPMSYQLFVTGHREVVPAIEALHRFKAEAVDLNMGCPAPTIRSAGGGSCLMDDPETLNRILAAARRCTELPLTAKIRLGERLDAQKLKNLCRTLEGEGIDMLTVHARLRKERFCRKPRWEWVGRVKEWVSIPVIANGSIASVEDAGACLAASGADGLMIGRAAAEKPWIFSEIARETYRVGLRETKVVLPEVFAQVLEGLVNRFRPERRLGRLKEFTHYFARNYTFGHHLASAVQSSGSVEEAWKRASAFFAANDPENWAGGEKGLATFSSLAG